MSEIVKVLGKETRDADGRKTVVGGGHVLEDCVITPQGKIDLYDQDVAGGNSLQLQISYSADSGDIEDDVFLDVRGTLYRTIYPSWDFASGRRAAWLSIHRPQKVVIAERVEA